MPRTDRSNMMIPAIHLNGTSEVGLIEPLMKARDLTIAAQRALTNASPHGRDYYVQSETAYQRARGQHLQRHDYLSAVIDELGWIIQGILAQQRKKR